MIIGIDLGTSTSEVSILKNGKPHLIREVRGSAQGILPSVIGLNAKGKVIVGEDMVAQLVLKPDLAVQEVKRKMGESVCLKLGAEEYTPQELSSFILRYLKEEAERFLGHPVTEAIITVPAYFNDLQRRATQDAGELAGLTVRRLINEPTAAALAYGIEKHGAEEIVLVYDFGGGTLDVTVLELSEGILDVLASTGNSRLGGKDLDERLMSFAATECRRRTGLELLSQPKWRGRLKAACKKAKETLSASESVTITLDNLSIGQDGNPIDFELDVSRERFDDLVRDLVFSTKVQIDEALAAKNISPDQVATVLLVGGSTRVPLVRDFVSRYFGGRTFPTHVSPDEAVSLGAAVLGGIVEGRLDSSSVVITDVSAHTLGIAVVREVDDERVSGIFDPLIEKNTTIPRTVKKSYTTSNDWQDAVHVEVFQGDGPMCVNNEPVAVVVHPMKPAPAGAKLDIEFSYDLSGAVRVLVRDTQTGLETQKVLALGNRRMSESGKAASRKRLDEKWVTGSAADTSPAARPAPPSARPGSTAADRDTASVEGMPLYARVAALITFADKQLATLPEKEKRRVADLLATMRKAIRTNDSRSLDTSEQSLTDLLFELS